MSKIELQDIASGFGLQLALNNNNEVLEDAFDNTLSRDGSTPNGMLASLDMNSNRIINLASPENSQDAARWADVAEASAIDVIAPAQVGNDDKALFTDGTTLSWRATPYIPITDEEVEADVTIADFRKAPGNVLRYGENTVPGTTNMAVALQAAHDQCDAGGARPFLPTGDYLINGDITPCQSGMYGEGPDSSRLFFNNGGFVIPSDAGWDRRAPTFEQFSIDSNNGTSCDAKWVFEAPGVAGGAAVVYNSGFIARNLCIGRTGRFGGAFYLKDMSDVTISDISVTDAQRFARIVGSVLQCKVSDIHAFLGDGAGTGLAGGSVGFSTESATYASGSLTPEHLTTEDMSLIVFDTGVQHAAGLDINFKDTDIQAKTIGMSLDAPCDVNGAVIIPHSTGVTSWTGLLIGVSPTTPDARFINNVHIEVGNSPGTPATSYGIDIGNGTNPTFGVFLNSCRVKGNAASLQHLVRGRVLKEFSMVNCVFDHATAVSTDVALSSAERVQMLFNHCAGGTFAVGDGGNSEGNGHIEFNQISTLTMSPMTTRTNWKIDINDLVKRRNSGTSNVADAGVVTHGLSSTPTTVLVSGTVASEMISVTAKAGTTFTLAIKKHDNTAGTTQDVSWEAWY
jgi:hypothetical protein